MGAHCLKLLDWICQGCILADYNTDNRQGIQCIVKKDVHDRFRQQALDRDVSINVLLKALVLIHLGELGVLWLDVPGDELTAYVRGK